MSVSRFKMYRESNCAVNTNRKESGPNPSSATSNGSAEISGEALPQIWRILAARTGPGIVSTRWTLKVLQLWSGQGEGIHSPYP